MTKADQFREYAEEAMQWSRQSQTEEAKKVLVDLAFTRPRPVPPKRWAVGLLKPWPSVLTPRSTVSATREPFY